MAREREIVIEITMGRLGPLLLLVVVLSVLALGPVARAEPEQIPVPASTAWTASVPGRYYLTKTIHDGAGALTACTDGYHMASLWEILDPSNLIYDTDLGRSQDDSGSGPPTYPSAHGWLRTGYSSSGSGSAGMANCRAWSSDSATDHGTFSWLPSDWTASTDVGGWQVATGQCNIHRAVWCVRPPFYVYLPLVLRNY